MGSKDRRIDPRKSVSQPAELMAAQLKTAIFCQLQDISASGARIKLPDELYLYRMKWPKRLTLRIPLDHSEIDCSIVQIRGHEFGLRFLSPFRNASRARLAA